MREFAKEERIYTQSTLALCGVELSDSGGYTCVVESGYTSDRLTMQLTVNDYKGQKGNS